MIIKNSIRGIAGNMFHCLKRNYNEFNEFQ
jgi:hypothetical protein